MATLKAYGSWSAEAFQNQFPRLSPESDSTDETIGYLIDSLKKFKSYESFIVAFREFLLDDSIGIEKKADIYFEENEWTPAEAWDHFKWIWETMAPEEPWPLNDRSRPEDTPPRRWYQFKPE